VETECSATLAPTAERQRNATESRKETSPYAVPLILAVAPIDAPGTSAGRFHQPPLHVIYKKYTQPSHKSVDSALQLDLL